MGARTSRLRFQFSEPVTITDEADFRGDSARALGGTVTAARRLSGDHWEVTVTPDGGGAVVVELLDWTGCDPRGAICTEDGRPLDERVEAVVAGPDTEVVTVRTNSSSLTEGETASFQLLRTGMATSSLSVGVTVSETGQFMDGLPPRTVSFDTGLSEIGLEIQTQDDLRAEFGGPDRGEHRAGSAYTAGVRRRAGVPGRGASAGQRRGGNCHPVEPS